MWCIDWSDMLLYSALLDTPTPSLRPHPLHALLPPDTPTPITLAPAASSEGVWLRAGHRHWLASLVGSELSVTSSIEVGVAMVGMCDVGGSGDVETWDVRLEQEETNHFQLAYYRGDGGKKVGGAYFVDEDRGRPVQVRIVNVGVWIASVFALDRLPFNSTPNLTNPWSSVSSW